MYTLINLLYGGSDLPKLSTFVYRQFVL